VPTKMNGLDMVFSRARSPLDRGLESTIRTLPRVRFGRAGRTRAGDWVFLPTATTGQNGAREDR
jgi:hypothetical protein